MPGSRREVALVAALTSAAFALRVAGFGQSLSGDELIAFAHVHDLGLLDVVRTVRDDSGAAAENTPPLFFLLAWAGAKLGDPTVWIRLPSLLASTAAVPTVYALGRLTSNRNAALVGAGLMAVSPSAIFFADYARPYALLLFLCPASSVALLIALRRGTPGWWFLYGLGACAVLYTHYTGVFVLGVQAAWALATHRDRLRTLVLVHAGVAAAFLPWLVGLESRNLETYDLLARPRGETILAWLAGSPSLPLDEVPGTVELWILAGAIAAGLLGARPRRMTREGALMALLSAATPISLLAYSWIGHDIFQPRNLVASLPYAALVVGWVLTRPRGAWRLAVVIPAMAVMIVAAVGMLSPDRQHPNWRAAAAYIDDSAQPADVIACDPWPAADPVLVQTDRSHRCIASDSEPQWNRALRDGRVFVVMPSITAPYFAPPDGVRGLRTTVARRFRGTLPLSVLVAERRSG